VRWEIELTDGRVLCVYGTKAEAAKRVWDHLWGATPGQPDSRTMRICLRATAERLKRRAL